MKTCTRCRETKTLDCFSSHKNSRDRKQSWCRSCVAMRVRENKRKDRAELIADLGGKCACCGEDTYEFLQIDHINDDGHKHRYHEGKKYTSTGNRYSYISIPRLRDHIEELQVLCANCHNAKSFYGGCPHQNS